MRVVVDSKFWIKSFCVADVTGNYMDVAQSFSGLSEQKGIWTFHLNHIIYILYFSIAYLCYLNYFISWTESSNKIEKVNENIDLDAEEKMSTAKNSVSDESNSLDDCPFPSVNKHWILMNKMNWSSIYITFWLFEFESE